MKRKHGLIAITLCSSLILSGCSDIVAGTDAAKPVTYIANEGTHGTQLAFNTKTEIALACEKFFNYLSDKDYSSALACLDIPDSSFITADDLSSWVSENIEGFGKLVSCEESSQSGIRYATCTLENISEPLVLTLTNSAEITNSETSGTSSDSESDNTSKADTAASSDDTATSSADTAASSVDTAASSADTAASSDDTAASEPSSSSETSGTWLISLPNFIITGQVITAPADMPLTLDDKDISKYKSTAGEVSTYELPALVYGSHKIGIKTAFDTLDNTVQLTSAPVDISEYLYIAEPRRSQILESYAIPLLRNANSAVLKNDWGKFTGYFDPDLDASALSAFSSSFSAGYKLKSRVYDLKMLSNDSKNKSYARDLGDNLNIRYVSYDTIEAKFGTRWSYSPVGEFEEQEDGSIRVSSTTEMKIINTLRLRYKNKKWYLVSIDDDSLAKIAPELEQWR